MDEATNRVIQREWTRGNDLWNEANFAILNRSGHPMDPADLPPHHRVFEIERDGSSLAIRNRVFHRQPIDELVVPEVDDLHPAGIGCTRAWRHHDRRDSGLPGSATWWLPTSGTPRPAQWPRDWRRTTTKTPS